MTYSGLHNGLKDGSFLNHNNGLLNNDFYNSALLLETRNYLRGIAIDKPYVNLINGFIKNLKLDGNWDLIDVMYLFAVSDRTLARRNLKNPELFNITEVGSPIFTSNQGIVGGTTSDYLKTGWIPSVNGLNYSLNDGSFGIYSRTDDSAITTSRIDFGSNDGTNSLELRIRDTTGLRRCRFNASTLTSSAYTGNTLGLFYGYRNASTGTSIKLGHNSTDEFTPTDTVTTIPNREIYIGCSNVSGAPTNASTKQYSFFWVGSSRVNISLMYTRIQDYLTALGSQV